MSGSKITMLGGLKRICATVVLYVVSVIALTYSIIFLFAPFFEPKNDSILKAIQYYTIFFLGATYLIKYINGFFVGKHFDKLFKQKILSSSLTGLLVHPVFSGRAVVKTRIARASLYAFCIVYPNPYRFYFYRKLFDSYDFKENATKIEKMLSYLSYCSLSLLCLGLLLVVFIKIYNMI